MRFYNYFLKYNVFIYILTAMIFISAVYFILRPVERMNLGDQLKKRDLSAKVWNGVYIIIQFQLYLYCFNLFLLINIYDLLINLMTF